MALPTRATSPTASPSIPLIRKLPQASYPHPSEGRQNEKHNHKKLTKLITQITALSNSMKPWAMPCRATQDWRVMVESSDKMWSTGEGNGKPLQHFCFENPMNSMKVHLGNFKYVFWDNSEWIMTLTFCNWLSSTKDYLFPVLNATNIYWAHCYM